MSDDRGADQGQKSALIGTHAPRGGDAGGDAARAAAPGAVPDPDADLFGGAIPSVAKRAAGRPEGAPNIRTNKTFQVAVSRYGDPLITSVALGNMDTIELIRWVRQVASETGLKMGMTVKEFLEFQRECRKDAFPYGHAKRVPVTEKGEDALPVIVFGGSGNTNNVQIGAAAAPALDLETALAMRDKAQQDQQLIDVSPNKSHDGKSHDDASN
jgi:hypothetical protein